MESQREIISCFSDEALGISSYSPRKAKSKCSFFFNWVIEIQMFLMHVNCKWRLLLPVSTPIIYKVQPKAVTLPDGFLS